MTNLDSILKSRDITLSTKVFIVKDLVFPVVIYGCESWTTKKAEHKGIDTFELWCCRRLLRVSWTTRRSNPKGNQPCIFIGRTKAVVTILWPPDTKSQLIGIDPDAGKDWGQKEKGVAGDEMVGWHHQLSGHDFDETPRNRKRQKSLDCCSPWVTKSQTWLNYWTTTAMGFWKSSCLTGW